MVDYSGEKEAAEIGAKIVTALAFLFVVDSYKKAFTISTNAKYKKGALAIEIKKKVNKEKFSDLIYSYYEAIGDLVFDIMAVYATDFFHQNYKKVHNDKHKKDKTKQRPFLFSDIGVAYEIKEHVIGYWHSTGKSSYKTFVTNLMYTAKVISKGKTKKAVENSCATIDIAEQDVTAPDDCLIFGYFAYIRSCYMYTIADPFWYGGYDRRTTVRLEWKIAKISTSMLY